MELILIETCSKTKQIFLWKTFIIISRSIPNGFLVYTMIVGDTKKEETSSRVRKMIWYDYSIDRSAHCFEIVVSLYFYNCSFYVVDCIICLLYRLFIIVIMRKLSWKYCIPIGVFLTGVTIRWLSKRIMYMGSSRFVR